MSSPDSPDHTQPHLAQDLLLELKSRTSKVLGDIAALLESGAVEDEADRGVISAAVAFVENPTENLADIMGHTTNIGSVIGGYDMQGMDPPPAIDAMHAYLLALQCINRINFIEAGIEQGSGSPEIQHAIAQALDWATVLSGGYKDATLLGTVNELQVRLGAR